MAQRDDIRVKLTPEGVAEVVRALRQVNKEASDANRNTSRLLTEIKGLLPALGFGAVVTGFVSLTRAAADFDDTMLKASQRTGATVENFSALAFAARTADASLQDIETALGRLARNVSEFRQGGGEAADSLQALGFSARDFARTDTVEAFELIARRIAALPPGIDRTRLAIDLLGRGGARLIPLMQDLATKGLQQVRAEAESFGVLVRGETAEAAQQFNDDLTRLQTASSKLGRDLVRTMLPGLSEVTKAMSEAARESGILSAAWVGLGGLAALALGRTESQQVQQLADEIKIVEARIATLRERLAEGPIVAPLLGQINAGGLARLQTDIERDVALLATLKQRLAEVQKPAPKSTAEGDAALGLEFDVRKRIADLDKSIGAESLKSLDDLARRRQQIAAEELANAERLASARATTETQQTQIALDAIRQRQALLRQGFDTEIRSAQVREQALSEAAARSTARGRTLTELQTVIARESLDAQLSAAQRYYGELSRLNQSYVEQYRTAQTRIKALDDELTQSRQQNERDIADARRAGLSEAQRQAEDFRRLEQLRADFGGAVVRSAGAEARGLKQQFDELARGLRGVEGFESAVGRIDAEVQSLFSTLVSTERAREQALGRDAAAGVKATNAELAKTRALTTELSQAQLAPIRPTVDQQGLSGLRDEIAKALLASPFRINVAPVVQGAPAPAFAGGGYVPGSSPSPRADDKLVRVTSGEFVQQVAAVRHYGVGFMRDINAMRFPRFAAGGLVGDLAAANDSSSDSVVLDVRSGGRSISRLRGGREDVRQLVEWLKDLQQGMVR